MQVYMNWGIKDFPVIWIFNVSVMRLEIAYFSDGSLQHHNYLRLNFMRDLIQHDSDKFFKSYNSKICDDYMSTSRAY